MKLTALLRKLTALLQIWGNQFVTKTFHGTFPSFQKAITNWVGILNILYNKIIFHAATLNLLGCCVLI